MVLRWSTMLCPSPSIDIALRWSEKQFLAQRVGGPTPYGHPLATGWGTQPLRIESPRLPVFPFSRLPVLPSSRPLAYYFIEKNLKPTRRPHRSIFSIIARDLSVASVFLCANPKSGDSCEFFHKKGLTDIWICCIIGRL